MALKRGLTPNFALTSYCPAKSASFLTVYVFVYRCCCFVVVVVVCLFGCLFVCFRLFCFDCVCFGGGGEVSNDIQENCSFHNTECNVSLGRWEVGGGRE